MTEKTEDTFINELEKARKTLEAKGRKVSISDSVLKECGGSIRDYDLPYSTLAPLRGDSWN